MGEKSTPTPGVNTGDSNPSADDQTSAATSALPPDKEASGHLRAVAKLARAKAGLDQAKSEMEEAKTHMLQSSALLEAITKKLADKNLKVPQNLGDVATLTGQLQLKSMNFVEKWNNKVPLPDSPEAAEYHQGMDDIATGMAEMIFSAQSGKLGDLTTLTPAQHADFQAQTLVSALNLNDGQSQQIAGILNRYYAEADTRGLGGDAPPASGVDNWRQQRSAMSVRAFGELQSSLTPDQSAGFNRLYSPGPFLWTISIGGK